MSRHNISIVKGFNADPAEMRAMEIAEERLTWMDKHLIVKHRSGRWGEASMRKIGEMAGICHEMEIVVR